MWDSLPALVLLTLFVVIAHALGLLDATEGFFRRQALEAAVRQQLDDGKQPPAPEQRGVITVLEFSTVYRVAALEIDWPAGAASGASFMTASAAHAGPIRRVGGVRPIDRCKFAKALRELAAGLANAPERDERPLKVIGLDVDVAPLNEADGQRACGPPKTATATSATNVRPTVTETMTTALTELRRIAPVVAIALDRPTADERRVRNAFMATTCAIGIRYASPRHFGNRHDYPLDFPVGEMKGPRRLLGLVRAAETPFPSLGNLIRFIAWPDDENTPPRQGVDEPGQLCREAAPPGAGAPPTRRFAGPILEDRIARPFECTARRGEPAPCGTAAFELASYETLPFNWQRSHPALILPVTIDRPDVLGEGCGENCIAAQVADAVALIIGIDGGDAHDKFDVPDPAGEPVSGAMLHALGAQSGLHDVELRLHSWVPIAVDLAIGSVFLLIWSLAAIAIDRMPHESSRASFARLLVPPVIAGLLGWMSIEWLAPALMRSDNLLRGNHWANPAYVLFGLVVHVYVEGQHGKEEPGADFTFGLRRWRQARRGLFPAGAVGVFPPPESQQRVEHADALLAFVARWLVLVAGLGVIAGQVAEHFDEGHDIGPHKVEGAHHAVHSVRP